MAVYTELTDQELRKFVNHFALGELVRAHGIVAGTINTIYDLTTTQGHYILRILEGRTRAEAQFEERLIEHLIAKGLWVPRMMLLAVGAGRFYRLDPVSKSLFWNLLKVVSSRCSR